MDFALSDDLKDIQQAVKALCERFDGGPVGHWCCPMHSVTTPEETVARVTAALCEWREWTESLARWFDTYPLDMAAVEDQRILWERTARNLILHVVDRTGCGSGWYGHCRQVLTWFLSRWGVEPGLARELVDRAVGDDPARRLDR